MSTHDGLIYENLVALQQGIDLIESLSDDVYANNAIPLYGSGVGKHFRHILDFFSAFLNADGERVDYDARGRSTNVETQREAAVTRIQETMAALKQVGHPDTECLSKNDDCGERDPATAFSRSSFGRELQFLASHTVHHYAMIAMILHAQGVAPPTDFGVAPSTLIHWRKQSQTAS